MNARLLVRKLMFKFSANSLEFKGCQIYSLSNRSFCHLNRDSSKTIKTNNKLVSNINKSDKYLFTYSFFGLNANRSSFELTKRNLSQDRDPDNEEKTSWKTRLPVLMQFEPKFWPNLWYQWKNFVVIYLIIKPYLDNDFSLDKFMLGSRQALVHISNCLADGKLDSLQGLVTDQALAEIRQNYSLFSAKQLEELRIQLEDIIYSFPYRIGIIMNDNDDKRFVEITVISYCLYKYRMINERSNLSFQEFKDKYENDITVCNYRFIRDYTKGVESDWTVNLLGYFKRD